MKNSRPSKLQNIGEDVSGAARHHRDTYDVDQHNKKAKEKAQTKAKNLLKLNALKEIKTAVNPLEIIEIYEINSFCSAFDIENVNAKSMSDLKSIVLGLKSHERFNEMAKAFNRASRKVRKAKFYGEDFQRAYFDKKTKDSFHEKNGVEKPWKSESDSFDMSSIDGKVRALQFGNSVTDNERVYCASNLKNSIELIERFFSIDLKTLAFAFGSRGKAGSIAHFEPSKRILAFNRGWIGAFCHELGHAVDESLGRPSYLMPWDIKKDYLAKIKDNPNRKYYAKNSEIFARMFEMYCLNVLGIKDEFFLSIFDASVMPEMNQEQINWMQNTLNKILVKN